MGVKNQQYSFSRDTKPYDVDAHVGRRLRDRRCALGLSQQQLAQAIGISFQQLQKYEKGTNRIGCGRIFLIAQILRVSITYFFEDLDEYGLSEDEGVPYDFDPVLKRETLALMRAYCEIRNADDRKKVLKYVQDLAKVSALEKQESGYKQKQKPKDEP